VFRRPGRKKKKKRIKTRPVLGRGGGKHKGGGRGKAFDESFRGGKGKKKDPGGEQLERGEGGGETHVFFYIIRKGEGKPGHLLPHNRSIGKRRKNFLQRKKRRRRREDSFQSACP